MARARPKSSVQGARRASPPRRRTPKQARAEATVGAIFEATARLLEQGHTGELSTNRIAEYAGVSIGTLYQYFSDKRAILVAMARRQIAGHTQAVVRALAAPTTRKIGRERAVVRALMAALGARHRARRALLHALATEGLVEEFFPPFEEVARALRKDSDRLLPPRSPPLSEARAFVLTRAVMGVLAIATREQSPWLGTQELEDELVLLVQAYLGADSPSGADPSNR